MKKLLLLFIIFLGTFTSFSQQAKGHLFTDVVSNKQYYVRQGAEIVVSSLGEKQNTTFDSASTYSIHTPDGKFDYSDLDYIKYKDTEKIETWKKFLLKDLWISPLLVIIGYGLTFLGLFIGVIFTVTGFLGLFLLIPLLIIFLVVSGGLKISLKK
ncbi:MAG: hypothetical protein U9Q83_10975 [Bacteroidota bacterium]|nr:hypothetical protein [Bacteroidota bacterium]